MRVVLGKFITGSPNVRFAIRAVKCMTDTELHKQTIEFARKILVRHEGIRSEPYVCPAGRLSIGIGRNLEDVGLADDEIQYLFLNDLKTANRTARHLFGKEFDHLDPVRRAAIYDLSFNMGQTRLAQFTNFRGSVDVHDWMEAGKHLCDSNYARQLPKRSKRIRHMIEKGTMPDDV